MQNITIIAVGKTQNGFLSDGCSEYIKRLKSSVNLKIVEIDEEKLDEKHTSQSQIDKALDREGEKILMNIPKQSYIISMCIEGVQISSEELANMISEKANSGYSNLCFIIGSSHGLSKIVKEKSDFRLSFSKMTFPHQLFRLILLEQIYRAISINLGTKYHK